MLAVDPTILPTGLKARSVDMTRGGMLKHTKDEPPGCYAWHCRAFAGCPGYGLDKQISRAKA